MTHNPEHLKAAAKRLGWDELRYYTKDPDNLVGWWADTGTDWEHVGSDADLCAALVKTMPYWTIGTSGKNVPATLFCITCGAWPNERVEFGPDPLSTVLAACYAMQEEEHGA